MLNTALAGKYSSVDRNLAGVKGQLGERSTGVMGQLV